MKSKKIDVLIIPDFEKGHLVPTFKIAKNLISQNIQVCYLILPDNEEAIIEKGLNYRLIFENLYPKGFLSSLDKNSHEASNIFYRHYIALLSGELDKLIEELKPKLILASYFISFEVLILHYRYEINTIIYHTLFIPIEENAENISYSIRSANNCVKTFLNLSGEIPQLLFNFLDQKKIRFTNFSELVAPMTKMKQFILCPDFFNIKNSEATESDIFFGPRVDMTEKIDEEFMDIVLKKSENKKIIYASMGTQSDQYKERVKLFYKSILECMESYSFENYHLVLSLGRSKENFGYLKIPRNVSVFEWVPQLTILNYAEIAIIHGGLGTIKECLLYGKKMLVVPMGRDQFDNGKRIMYHKLGLIVDSEDIISIDKLTKKIESVLNSFEISIHVQKMQELFQLEEKKMQEVEIIKEMLLL